MYIRRQTERHQLVVVLCNDIFIDVITNLCKNTTCSITDSYQRMQQFHSSISKRNLILEIFAVQAKDASI
ncbi:hypothetical protein T08_9895 [Trichinella sp. T8]|nr:hypothetical protein T08_9895 [Trichinella sp. T8]